MQIVTPSVKGHSGHANGNTLNNVSYHLCCMSLRAYIASNCVVWLHNILVVISNFKAYNIYHSLYFLIYDV